MAVGFEEFSTYALDAVHTLAGEALAGERDEHEALRLIEQACTEPNLAYEDGGRLEDDEVRANLLAHYGEPREPTWCSVPNVPNESR